MSEVKVIAEIGINYAYGDDRSKFMNNIKKLIDIASVSGCDYVKFQKRDPDVCVPEEQKNKSKKVPWREEETTYLQYKIDIELSESDYDEINNYCISKQIGWFVSVWDKNSVDFMEKWVKNLPTHMDLGKYMKIPSALITDLELCKYAREKSSKLMISTGMSTESEILECISTCNPDVIMHTNSSYPSHVDELNLEYINWLKDNNPGKEIGYSGHEYGLVTTMATVALGVKWIERHVTIDRTLWGSDQMASVEAGGMMKLVKGIRDIELSLGVYGERVCLGSELEKRKSLRGE